MKKKAAPVDPDGLPFPAFHLLDMNYYTKRSLFTIWGHFVKSVTLMASRGCSGSCSYCLESRAFGPQMRYRKLDLVLEDIKRALTDYPIDAIYFRDCNFLNSRERSLEFASRVLQLNRRFVWACQTRVDTVDLELLRLLKRAGCVLIEFGVETPLASNLTRLGKKVEPGAPDRAFGLCRQAGINSHAYLLTGYPGETLDDFRSCLEWIKNSSADNYFWNQLRVLPGTPLYAGYGESFFETHDWTDRKEVERFFKRNLGDADSAGRSRVYHEEAYPALCRQRRRLILKANGPLKVLALAGRKLKRSLFPRPDFKGDADA